MWLLKFSAPVVVLIYLECYTFDEQHCFLCSERHGPGQLGGCCQKESPGYYWLWCCQAVQDYWSVIYGVVLFICLIYVYMISWIICMRYGWFFLMICWRTDTKIMSPWTTFCLLIMYNKWIPCCCASPQKYITDDVKMGNEHQWHTRLRLVSFFCIHIWHHLWSITEHTHENMDLFQLIGRAISVLRRS